ncbi:MAG: BON domain-containing protein, partial [Gammaproteobacteria bacterium]|nr:BON domain-containing protein [Gammaproteobacteria bacterium]
MKTDKRILRLAFLLAILACLHGCAAVAVGGGATAATLAADRRTAGTVVEDEAIELKAKKLFYENEEIRDKTHINVTSYNTRVLVTGEAPTEALKKRVIELVRG